MIGFITVIIFIIIIVMAFNAIIQTKLIDSIILFMGLGLGSVILFLLFQAPDVALTEAVVGSGVSATIFLVALKHLGVQK